MLRGQANQAHQGQSKEAKAKARLERARALVGAGKRDQPIRRLRKLVWHYPKTRAAVVPLVILSYTRSKGPAGE